MSESVVKKKNPVSTQTTVELGYLEEVEVDDDRLILQSVHFPSKMGGKPAWLSMQPLPEKLKFKCKVCEQQLCFLLQIYAPDYDQESAFHRSIFLFVCRNGSCNKANLAENFVAFRCQLPRINKFYSENALKDKEQAEMATKNLEQFTKKMCLVCRCPAENRCSKCKQAVYCDRSHQVLHWKWGHKDFCNTEQYLDEFDDQNDFLFKEHELVIETEVLENNNQPEKSESEKMQEFHKYTKMLNLPDSSEKGAKIVAKKDTRDDLDLMSNSQADKLFKKFSARLQQNPDQVLRYERNGQPLWATDLTPKRVPHCENCGAERSFEFQIMPCLLSYLNVDEVGASLDWATVAVYTCSKSCNIPENGYSMEFVWKQDFSD